MKKLLLTLLIAFATTAYAQDPSIEITSAITTAEAGGTVTVDFTYTSTNPSNYIFAGINLYDDTNYVSFLVGGELTQAPAGTDLTGSISFVIPEGATPTSDLTGNENYKLSIEMKEDVGWTFLAGDYPTDEVVITNNTGTVPDSIEITSTDLSVVQGTTYTVDFTYTSSNSSNYIFAGINLFDNSNYVSYLGGGEYAQAPAGTDMVGSISFEIPSDATLTSDLSDTANYRLLIEMKEDVNFTLLASTTLSDPINIVESLSSDSFLDGQNEIKIFPNPTTDFIEINGLNIAGISNLTIFNTLGKKVFSSENLLANKIDVSQLNTGVYFISIANEGKVQTMKFIKK